MNFIQAGRRSSFASEKLLGVLYHIANKKATKNTPLFVVFIAHCPCFAGINDIRNFAFHDFR